MSADLVVTRVRAEERALARLIERHEGPAGTCEEDIFTCLCQTAAEYRKQEARWQT